MAKPENETVLLALDVGNTNVVLGIFHGDKLLTRRRLATLSGRTADEAGVLVKMLCLDAGEDPSNIDAVAIASVAPKTGMVYGQMAESYLGCKPFFIHGELPGFVNKYRNPRAVGADRVCDAVAGYHEHGGPLLILDFGTAITIDVVGEKGDYLGGVILPGLETSTETLHQKAALLPSVRLTMPDAIIGSTTDESIRIGLVRGTVHALRGLINEIKNELQSPDAKVIATGGLANTLAAHIPEISHVDPDLVLKGIKLLYERNG